MGVMTRCDLTTIRANPIWDPHATVLVNVKSMRHMEITWDPGQMRSTVVQSFVYE